MISNYYLSQSNRTIIRRKQSGSENCKVIFLEHLDKISKYYGILHHTSSKYYIINRGLFSEKFYCLKSKLDYGMMKPG